MSWNWEAVIKRNRNDLAKIIAGLYILAGWLPGGDKPRFIPRTARDEFARLLRVTEAALRRLIVIVATTRGCKEAAGTVSAKALPDFSKFAGGTSNRSPAFNLIDPRKPIRFVDAADWSGTRGSEPRIWTLETMEAASTGTSIAQKEQHPSPAETDSERTTTLLRRLQALDNALRTLPRQARRYSRITQDRKTKPSGQRQLHPVRVGTPPGHRKKPIHDADHVLIECHGLVRDLQGGLP